MFQLTIKNPKKVIFKTVFYNEDDALLFIRKQGIEIEDKRFLDEYYPIHKFVKTFGYFTHKSQTNGYSEITIRRAYVESTRVDFKENHTKLVAILSKMIEGMNNLKIYEKVGKIYLFIENEKTKNFDYEIGRVEFDDKINLLKFCIDGKDDGYQKEFDIFQKFMKELKALHLGIKKPLTN